LQRYLIQLSFKGTCYHGWQIQPNGISVQKVLETTISTLLREQVAITGAGRTDAGVHALFFIAHFDALKNDLDSPDFIRHLNSFLPEDIAVQAVKKADPGFHARFSALSRTYIYVISRRKDPFSVEQSFYYPGILDMAKMNEAAEVLTQYSDFTSFSRLHSDVKTNICRVTYARWEESEGKLVFTITADRFLRNMVRAITGTLIDVGRGKISAENFRTIIEKKERKAAGASAPAKGLFLKHIDYQLV